MPRFHILNVGYGGDRVASTISLVEAGDSLIAIDPGMVSSTSVILDPIAELGRSPEEVTDVILSITTPTIPSTSPFSPTPRSTTTGPSTRTTYGPPARPRVSKWLMARSCGRT